MFNKKMTVTIAEPWNFTSSEGDNTLIVEMLTQNDDGFIAKCCSNFDGKKNRLLFRKRNSYGQYNIHGIDDSIISNVIESSSLEFIMIGTVHY